MQKLVYRQALVPMLTVSDENRPKLSVKFADRARTGSGVVHNRTGYLGFLGHTMPVRMRNIRVREL